MDIKLPAGLGGAAMLRVAAIIQQAPRNGDGTLSEEGSRFIRETVTAEFGSDMADTLLNGHKVELDYSRSPKNAS
ncbi:MAG: hypothetical protein SFX73_31825 [Kofleriaceae bacterium]|nr:hypothetical protein [Kofleriaceae bacterium]